VFYVCHVQPQEDQSAVVAHKTGVTFFIVMKTSNLIMEQFLITLDNFQIVLFWMGTNLVL